MSKPKGAEPYFEFRSMVIDRAVELLSSRLEIQNPKEAVRNAIQMLLAMATDEACRHGIPFKTERKRELAGIYENLLLRCLGLPPGRRDTKGSSAVDTPDALLGEHLKVTYGITKRTLGKYEKTVNASRKPEFKLEEPVDPQDATILSSKKENLKTEKPQKRKRKRKYTLL